MTDFREEGHVIESESQRQETVPLALNMGEGDTRLDYILEKGKKQILPESLSNKNGPVDRGSSPVKCFEF